MKIHLLVIDPQVDFCDPKGNLYVGGADKDMERLAVMVNRLGSKLDDIHVTLDCHHLVDIAHPIFWKDANGNHPNPFTIITMDDLKAGRFTTTVPAAMPRAMKYVEHLAINGRYPLCIWPKHCLIGTVGNTIYTPILEALMGWEEQNIAEVDKVTKGSNPWTEHYSAVQADVPDPQDPGTMLNTRLIQTLQEADVIAIAGEALSHCVKFTIEDIADNFGDENIKKFVLIRDCTSPVPYFEQQGIDFVEGLCKRGMTVTTSDKFFA